ncbi:unnamed protein product [Cylindrotheca closterium]|uniref:DDT domain-containing protein n=1 Tax=Cylindrotheca closterium TaxID=2856 RepID=A0AAD2FG03_9STRA|nr:unnamed protein product [Cylindrotheca closterium]
MADHDIELKEKKRKKALRRMGKMVGHAWNLANAGPFQAGGGKSTDAILCLTSLGQKVDDGNYKYGRHGWEDFARDLGGVYNSHIHRKTKHAKMAKDHLDQVCAMLAEKDDSLARVAKDFVPDSKPSKKRKADTPDSRSRKKPASAKKPNGGDMALSEREDQAMEALGAFMEEKGGSKEVVKNFRCRVQKQPGGRFDTNYYNEHGRRFRSMVEVGRFLGLVTAEPRRSAAGKRAKVSRAKVKKATSRETEAEKKRLRKELDKLRKQHTKITKSLDDFLTDHKDSQYPIEDSMLQEEETAAGKGSRILPTNSAAARIPDVDRFEGIPQHCMPDVLVAWDFLCTFTRALSLTPISLDDFVLCLTYMPPEKSSDSDALNTPPVYLGEVHLSLLKLILSDRSSDEWWWSILEAPVAESSVVENADATDNVDESDLPLIKVDFAALLGEQEDPLITTSWLTALHDIPKMSATNSAAIKASIKTATDICGNKFVIAYLKKATKLGKTSGSGFMKRAVVWLLERMREARPDLGNRNINKEAVFKKRAKVVDEVSQQMDKLSSAALAVEDDDLLSDAESDDDSDDSDVEEENGDTVKQEPQSQTEPDDHPASFIPPKPPPTLVDLLLPPGKPSPPSELFNPSSWPHLAGATVCRLLHRYTRLRNEVDDSLRSVREVSRLTVRQRREREAIAKTRVFSEFAVPHDGKDPCDTAAQHLCSGGRYLELTPLERLCILRVLIDAAYDTARVYEVVDTNYKQSTSAVKALETEQRKFKREAKEKSAANEAAARQDLALEARRNFIEEKREEIRKANEANQELTDDDIDELTEDDIIEFDEDFKADFEALPAPESFKKAEVVARVAKMLEADAFETELLTVLTMDQILENEKEHVQSLEESLAALGGEEALLNPELDRDTMRAVEKLRRELLKIQASAESIPIQREEAIEQLKEAIADGTIKSLRAAIRSAKTARLFGKDDDTNGVWSLDIVRDAHMELENAKQLKRVADAQKDLVSKRNRCFIRTEPLGSDRFRNRFWTFENSEQGHIFTEVDHVLEEENKNLSNESGLLEIVSSVDKVEIGSADIEEDFMGAEGEGIASFRRFSRKEYHQSGLCASLTKRCWGWQLTESSVRALTKGLDGRGVRENNLKKNLKVALEAKTTAKEGTDETESDSQVQKSGDEDHFAHAKQRMDELDLQVIDASYLNTLSSAIGQMVRFRHVVESTRDRESARYEVGSIKGWKLRKDEVTMEPEGDEFEPQTQVVEVPVWQVMTDKGNEFWLTGGEMLESICRLAKWTSKCPTYFESDAAYLSYRNTLGRHFGKVAEAANAMTPIRFTQSMVKREAEIYQKLKHRVYDETWGGKNGTRSAWVTSMRDFAFDFETARDGLLTFESALFELTGGFPGDDNGEEGRSGRSLLDNKVTREDIELESLEKGMNRLWNSRESRNVFHEIVKSAKTVGFLVLALDLVCRNAYVYLEANKIKTTSTRSSAYGSSVGDSWQQQADVSYYEEPTSRRSRRGNVDYSVYFN